MTIPKDGLSSGGAPSSSPSSGPSASAPSSAAGAPGKSAGPTTPGPAGASRNFVPTPRGPSSKTTLKIDWQHAKLPSAPLDPERTAAVPRGALSAAEALSVLAGSDPRPLLVLRECLRCSGTEDALLSSHEDNERTYLLTRWFNCVKLTPDVLDEDHAFRNLFPGDRPAHVFIANRDGSARHDLQGTHSRRELWAAMEDALDVNYQGGHAAALRRLTRLLDDLDEVDRTIADLDVRLEHAAGKKADAGSARKIEAELAERRAQRDELLAAAAKVSQLELRAPAAAPAAR